MKRFLDRLKQRNQTQKNVYQERIDFLEEVIQEKDRKIQELQEEIKSLNYFLEKCEDDKDYIPEDDEDDDYITEEDEFEEETDFEDNPEKLATLAFDLFSSDVDDGQFVMSNWNCKEDTIFVSLKRVKEGRCFVDNKTNQKTCGGYLMIKPDRKVYIGTYDKNITFTENGKVWKTRYLFTL